MKHRACYFRVSVCHISVIILPFIILTHPIKAIDIFIHLKIRHETRNVHVLHPTTTTSLSYHRHPHHYMPLSNSVVAHIEGGQFSCYPLLHPTAYKMWHQGAPLPSQTSPRSTASSTSLISPVSSSLYSLIRPPGRSTSPSTPFCKGE